VQITTDKSFPILFNESIIYQHPDCDLLRTLRNHASPQPLKPKHLHRSVVAQPISPPRWSSHT
jgi:hypothetical protein